MRRIFPKNLMRIIMHPAQPSKAGLGGVHFIFRHIQILTRLLYVELFRGYYVYCTYKLKRKPLFDGSGLGVLNIYGQ